MTRFSRLAVVAVLAAAPCVYADRSDAPAPQTAPDTARGARQPGDGSVRGERGLTTAAAYIAMMDPIVTLTEEQKKAIPGIFEIRDMAIKNFEAQNADAIKAASKAMEDAIQSKDSEAISKARQGYRDSFAPMHEIMRKANDDLENLLTPEQKTKLAEAQVIKAIQASVAPAQLTDDQLKKLIPLASTSSEGRRESLRDKIGPTLEQILTPEQKAIIAKRDTINEVMHNLGGARLSRDQIKQIDAAYDEVAKDSGTNKEDLIKKLTEKVNGILTDEQKEAIKTAAAAHPPGDSPRRER